MKHSADGQTENIPSVKATPENPKYLGAEKEKEGKFMKDNEMFFDGNNPKLIRNLMEQHGNSTSPFYGKNENDEDVEIHIGESNIVYKTYQNNGWVRINYYDEYGLPDGETFDGKWK